MRKKNLKTKLKKVENINIDDQIRDYRRYISLAKEVQEYAEKVFDTVKDMSLTERLTRDPYLVAIQTDEELKRDASLLYTAASAMDQMDWHFELHFEEYEVHVMILDNVFTPF